MPATASKIYSDAELKAAVYVRRLVCYDVANNNKKFWIGYVLPGGIYVAQFGMVDKTCSQTEPKDFGSEASARAEVDKNAKKKLNYSGDKAAYQEARIVEGTAAASNVSSNSGSAVAKSSLAKIAADQVDTNCPEVKELLKFLAASNRHTILKNTTMTYDESQGTFRTPLGIVTLDAIQDARKLLNDMSDYVMKRQWSNPTFIRNVNQYLMWIPQNVGHKLEVQNIFPDSSALQKQNGILDSLEASVQAVMTPKAVPNTPAAPEAAKIFNVKLHRKDDGKTMDFFRKLYRNSRQDQHVCSHLDVKTVYEVEISVAKAAWERDGVKVGGVVEAWHGSSHANILSILKQGLVVPPSSSPHVCGRMYGDGVYGAIASTKSLNYSYGYWNGSQNERCFMFRMDMSMGKYYVPSHSGGYRPAGYDSIWAKKGVSGVINDELIVPRSSMTNLKWLLEFTPHGK